MAAAPKTKNKGEQPNERIVREVSEQYKIPYEILWGVYGVETGHGSNVKTSSTGAKGSFQFEPETAKEYGYPYTNETTEKVFAEQAIGAAKYLSSLFAGSHSWDQALKAYSGGGYGLEQVKAQGGFKEPEFKEKSFFEGGSVNAQGAVENAVSNPLEALKSIGSFFTKLSKLWEEPERSAKFIGGSALLIIGLKTLTQGTAAESVGAAPAKAVGTIAGVATGGTSKAAKQIKLKNTAKKRAAKKPATKTKPKGERTMNKKPAKEKMRLNPSKTSSTGKAKTVSSTAKKAAEIGLEG